MKFVNWGTLKMSLSARRAWIEITLSRGMSQAATVALRKESVDRNDDKTLHRRGMAKSLSARRAWIEIFHYDGTTSDTYRRSPQGERG